LPRLGSTLPRPTKMWKQSSEQDVDEGRAIVTTSGQRGKKNMKTMIFNDKTKDFKPSKFRGYVMNAEEIVEQLLPRDDDVTDRDVNDVKVYTCEGCGETFPTGIAKATHCRNCMPYITWKAEQGEPTPREREDVEREDESIYRGEGDSNEILRQILTDFPGVCARLKDEMTVRTRILSLFSNVFSARNNIIRLTPILSGLLCLRPRRIVGASRPRSTTH